MATAGWPASRSFYLPPGGQQPHLPLQSFPCPVHTSGVKDGRLGVRDCSQPQARSLTRFTRACTSCRRAPRCRDATDGVRAEKSRRWYRTTASYALLRSPGGALTEVNASGRKTRCAAAKLHTHNFVYAVRLRHVRAKWCSAHGAPST